MIRRSQIIGYINGNGAIANHRVYKWGWRDRKSSGILMGMTRSQIIGYINLDDAIANHQIIVTPRQGEIQVIVTPRQGEAFRYKYSGEMQRLSPECFAPTVLLMC